MEMEEAKLKDRKTGQDASRDLIRWVLFLGDLHLPFDCPVLLLHSFVNIDISILCYACFRLH